MDQPEHPLILMTPEAAAERLSISRTRIYELLASRRLESVKIGRLRRIRPEHLESFVARLSEEGPHAA